MGIEDRCPRHWARRQLCPLDAYQTGHVGPKDMAELDLHVSDTTRSTPHEQTLCSEAITAWLGPWSGRLRPVWARLSDS